MQAQEWQLIFRECARQSFQCRSSESRCIPHHWEEEIPSEEDYENGNKNLKACDYKVDYVITHTCPLNLIPSLGGYHSAMEERQLQNYLQYVNETVYDSLTRWYFGHWHRDQEFGEKFRVVYLDLVDMETGKKIW